MIDQNVINAFATLRNALSKLYDEQVAGLVQLPVSSDPTAFNYQRGIIDGIGTAQAELERRISRMKEKFDEDEDEFTS